MRPLLTTLAFTILCCHMTTFLSLVTATEARAQTPTPSPSVTIKVGEVKPPEKKCVVVPSAPVNPKIKTWTYRGRKYGFCCTNCRNEFSKNKKKYAAFQAQRDANR